MNRTRLWVSAAIIAGIIFITFVLSVPHTRDLGTKQAAPLAASTPVVTLHDSFKKGLHTISGSLVAPDACTTVSAAATLTGDASSTESIALALTTTASPGICLQVPTKITFLATVSARASLPIAVTVNGTVASTTPS